MHEESHPGGTTGGGAARLQDPQHDDPSRDARQLPSDVIPARGTGDLSSARSRAPRPDRDFAVSWIREEGEGGGFYSSLGHRFEIFTDRTILHHWLAGIPYALGDLEADATPTGEQGWTTRAIEWDQPSFP